MKGRDEHTPDTRVSHFSDRLSGSRHSADMNWSAAILAGGRARRLGGQDKSALIVDGLRFIDRQREALQPLTDRIVLVGTRRRSHRVSSRGTRSVARRGSAGRAGHGAPDGHDRPSARAGVRPAVCHHPVSGVPRRRRSRSRGGRVPSATAAGSRSVRSMPGAPPIRLWPRSHAAIAPWRRSSVSFVRG